MKLNRIKLFAITFFVLSVLAVSSLKTNPTLAQTDDVGAKYKKDCALCHKPNAEKFFEPSKMDEVLVEIVLKGKKAEKPPNMPNFEAKGMTSDQAKLLVAYMRQMRTPASDK